MAMIPYTYMSEEEDGTRLYFHNGQVVYRGYPRDGDQLVVDDGSGTWWDNTGGGATKTTYDPGTGAVTGVYAAPQDDTRGGLSQILEVVQDTAPIWGGALASNTLAGLLDGAGGLSYVAGPAGGAGSLTSVVTPVVEDVALNPYEFWDTLPASAGGFPSTAIAGLGAVAGGAAGAAGGAGGAAGGAAAGASSPVLTGAATGAAGAGGAAVLSGQQEGDGSIGGGDYSSIEDKIGSNAAQGAAAGATSSALSRIIDGTASTADWLSLAGTAGATGLGLYGANQQATTLRDIANQARTDRAPYLAKANEWLASPAAYHDTVGKSSIDAVLRGLSVNGNPFDNPTSLGIASDAANRSYVNAVTGFANVGLTGQDSRNSLLKDAAGADASGLNALGYGLSQATAPKTSLEELLKQIRGSGTNALSLA